MTNAAVRVILGSSVRCSDGSRGDLARMVLDPAAHTLIYLVVETRDLARSGRLVPVSLVQIAPDEVQLRCTGAELAALTSAEEEALPPGLPDGDGGQWSYLERPALAWPNYARTPGLTNTGDVMVYHRVPAGAVEMSRGDPVHATDDTAGSLVGLAIRTDDVAVTHILLEERRRWSRKQVAVPIAAVSGFDDGVHVSITTDEVRDLPSADLDGGE